MRRLLNDGWSFARLPAGSGLAQAREAVFAPVDLPHDFLIENADNLYETCDGWYRRVLTVERGRLSQVILLHFDGVYMDCDVLVNGEVVCSHAYGYTAFDADLTPALRLGENTVMVHIRHRSPNSRWYSGAGIFRDVTLEVVDKCHIVPDSVYITCAHEKDAWQIRVSAEIASPERAKRVRCRVLNADGLPVFLETAEIGEGSSVRFAFCWPDAVARLWSPDAPYLYAAELTLGGQRLACRFGLRTATFHPEKGLLLNGRPVKLHGVCLHHDLGALGSAFHEKAARRQLRAMRRMGVNALRTSHNPPAARLLDLCDEMGILVIDEFLDMWESPKTAYDYARFFDEWAAEDAKSWICRDRNHPCVILWSIGNEIYDTHASPRGQELTAMLRNLVERHDPCHNARATIGSNYMPWENAQKCADILKIAGYNYAEKLYEAHHKAHPDWVLYGSETASAFASRGIYHFPADVGIMSDEDLQCSALGNSTASWGCRSLKRMIADDLNTPYSMGQFVWSGIDYIGEPTPYHTRSCYFGQMDTAVFPKDAFYQFQAAWTDQPVAHIGVYWDWNEGQLIDVPVMTNGASCELFLNGVSLGAKLVDLRDAEKALPMWKVPYAPGELCARAYDARGELIAEDHAYSFGEPARIVLESEDASLKADGRDMTFITVSMRDQNGRPVENALNRVHVSVTGAGRLLGLDNGDSTDRDGYKTTTRHLFSGKLLILAGALDQAGVMRVEVSAKGLATALLELPVEAAPRQEGVSCVQRIADTPLTPETWVRRIDLKALGPTRLTPEHPSVSFAVRVLPENADPQELFFRITNAAGIDSPRARVTRERDGRVTVTAVSDGAVYLRGTCRNGYGHTRVISQREIVVEGLGEPNLDPYGFVAGGLYDVHDGEVSYGNEQGVSFARDGYSMAGFSNVDFGPVGSDEITLPVFALNGDAYQIALWQGDPRKGGVKIAELPYQKPCVWNTYQSETYKLPVRLRGVQTICFSMTEKVHLKGFSFTRQSRAWVPQSALDADSVYGDSFVRSEEGILDIGNNVSLVFGNMDFEGETNVRLVLDGATPLPENAVTVISETADGEQLRGLCGFRHSPERTEQRFELTLLPGTCQITFVFLPGSRFDFYGFRFEKV